MKPVEVSSPFGDKWKHKRSFLSFLTLTVAGPCMSLILLRHSNVCTLLATEQRGEMSKRSEGISFDPALLARDFYYRPSNHIASESEEGERQLLVAFASTICMEIGEIFSKTSSHKDLLHVGFSFTKYPSQTPFGCKPSLIFPCQKKESGPVAHSFLFDCQSITHTAPEKEHRQDVQ